MQSAKNSHPFIPRDKPKFWVMGVLSGLTGLGAGLLALTAAFLGLVFIKTVFLAVFVGCWVTGAISWFGFMGRLTSDKYKNIE